MQAIAIGIGKNGITFFANHYLVATLLKLLGKLTPPPRTVTVPNFRWVLEGSRWDYSNISIALANGALQNFLPKFDSIVQGVDSKTKPIFTLTFEADNFSARYDWTESYHWEHSYYTFKGKIPVHHHDSGDSSTPLTYTPGFGKLSATVVVQFSFNAAHNAWEITVSNTTGQASGVQANIPSSSILQNQENTCFDSHVSEATAQAIDSIDFATPINSLITGIV